MQRLLLALCCLMLSACLKSTDPSDAQHQAFTLAPGELATTKDSAIRIQFEGVLSDSRCPIDVVCIQAGDAIVKIHVQSRDSQEQSYHLHTSDLQPVAHGGAKITLVQLMPYPVSSRTIAPDEYRATLLVTE